MTDTEAYIREFKKKRVLVVGDVMLDEYIEGTADRISPEAPIPVLLQKSVRHHLGGAGNVAANAAALGAKVTLVGIVGADARARLVASLSRSAGIRSKLIGDRSRPTTTKTRFVTGHHQVVRIDIEETASLSKKMEGEMVRMIRGLPKHDIVIISDYAKGCITPLVMAALRKYFGPENIIADMKPISAGLYKNISTITPNVKEAFDMTGIEARTDTDAARVTRKLSTKYKTSVVLTRGERGVSVRELGGAYKHFQNTVQSVKDVTGAGDTLVAAFALMRASGAHIFDAAEVANRAAGIVVGGAGTIALTHKALSAEIARTS